MHSGDALKEGLSKGRVLVRTIPKDWSPADLQKRKEFEEREFIANGSKHELKPEEFEDDEFFFGSEMDELVEKMSKSSMLN